MNSVSIGMHKSGLSGSALVAYGLLANKITGAVAKNVSRNVWADSLNLAISVVGEQTGDGAANAIAKAFGEVVRDLRGTAILKELDKAGYGGLSQVVMVDDGKEAVPTRVEKALHQRFGAKFRLGQQVDAAVKTAENYRDRYIKAVRAGVELVPGMTQRDLDQAREKAIFDSLSEAEQKERTAARDGLKNAEAMGKAFSDAILADDPGIREIGELFTTITVSFGYASDSLKHSFKDVLGPWADKFDEARRAAQAADEAAKADESEDETLADMEGVEKAHAQAA